MNLQRIPILLAPLLLFIVQGCSGAAAPLTLYLESDGKVVGAWNYDVLVGVADAEAVAMLRTDTGIPVYVRDLDAGTWIIRRRETGEEWRGKLGETAPPEALEVALIAMSQEEIDRSGLVFEVAP